MVKLAGFNANDVDPAKPFEPLPAADYLVIMTKSEMKDSKSGGKFLEMEFQVVEGEHKGRSVWGRLNLKNANKTAEDIAKAELSAICHAVGIMKPQDSSDFHNKRLFVVVKLKERDDKPGVLSNEIKGYLSVDSKDTTPEAAEPGPAESVEEKAPWD